MSHDRRIDDRATDRRMPRALSMAGRPAAARITPLLVAALLASSCGYLGLQPTEDEAAVEEAAGVSGPEVPEAGPLGPFLASIPDVEVPQLDLQMALSLVAMPLSCLDRPHAAPRDRSTYLDEIVAARRPGYERDRAFYGCWDWHSAVNSTWAMVRISKEFPALPVSGLVREKLDDHLSERALAGEMEFFAASGPFERTYGWAWLLKLQAELSTWDHPSASRWAANLAPLASFFSAQTIEFLADLERPSRSGTHSNTAFSLALMLDYARTVDDTELEEAIVAAAGRFFGGDLDCPTAYEPWGSDFLSPCLEEAKLMAGVLAADDFAGWFDAFMPAVDSREFLKLKAPVEVSEEGEAEEESAVDEDAAAPPEAAGAGEDAAVSLTAEAAKPEEGAALTEGEADTASDQDASSAEEQRVADERRRALGAKSHLIGLAFIRAEAMNAIAAALPAGDPRVAAYRKLAALHGARGFEAMFDAEYAGSHWIGTFALKYLLSERR